MMMVVVERGSWRRRGVGDRGFGRETTSRLVRGNWKDSVVAWLHHVDRLVGESRIAKTLFGEYC